MQPNQKENDPQVRAEARLAVLQILTASITVAIPPDLVEALVTVYLRSSPTGVVANLLGMGPDAVASSQGFSRIAVVGNLLNEAIAAAVHSLRHHPSIQAAIGGAGETHDSARFL